jgi:hypothetical protein
MVNYKGREYPSWEEARASMVAAPIVQDSIVAVAEPTTMPQDERGQADEASGLSLTLESTPAASGTAKRVSLAGRDRPRDSGGRAG